MWDVGWNVERCAMWNEVECGMWDEAECGLCHGMWNVV